jgi:hypothetical protein
MVKENLDTKTRNLENQSHSILSNKRKLEEIVQINTTIKQFFFKIMPDKDSVDQNFINFIDNYTKPFNLKLKKFITYDGFKASILFDFEFDNKTQANTIREFFSFTFQHGFKKINSISINNKKIIGEVEFLQVFDEPSLYEGGQNGYHMDDMPPPPM